MNESESLRKFINDQMSVWPLCTANFRALKNVRTRECIIGGLQVRLQCNPDRLISTAADFEAALEGRRPCFLCESGRFPEQGALKFEGRKGHKYDIMVNPYPIFPEHITVDAAEHTPQTIMNRFQDMTDLAHHFTQYTFFYNGPYSGASAPDHMHFQACPRSLMPLEEAVDKMLDAGGDARLRYLSSVKEASLYHCDLFTKGIFVLNAKTSKSLSKLFYRLIDCMPVPEGEPEPRLNIIMWYKPLSGDNRPEGSTHGLADFEYRAIVMLRDAHRPSCYFAEGADHLCFSPGCADKGGVLVIPSVEDYEKATPEALEQALAEVSAGQEVQDMVIRRLTRTQRTIQVGVLSSDEIVFEIISDGAGPQKVSYQEGKISYNGALYDELFFEAQTPSKMFAEPTFILHDVIIGVDFHWQRKVDQQFGGSLKFIVEKGKVVAVNVIGVEDYLLSVISSEMKSSATLEFLKAHSVISRSWILSQVEHRQRRKVRLPEGVNDIAAVVTDIDTRLGGAEKDGAAVPQTYIKWFDHEDHINFDVCADDHCQRYQGLTMAVGDKVRQAIDQTWGLVLKDRDGEICDCRFYKSCGGQTELFSTCWEDKDYDYLPSLPDTPGHDPSGHCFCNTHDKDILSQVLNDYDLETVDFYEWKEEYTREGVSELFRRRSGMDVGIIRDLIPLEKGPSGVIKKLQVVGDKATVVIGKELIVRRFLSESHLKSARFTVTWTDDDRLILSGSGWGHCVGLCQIGAAVMAYSGYTYSQILEHYYPGSKLETI